MIRFLSVATLLLLPALAHAETSFEIGVLAGGHLFSGTAELGVADDMEQPRLESFAAGGLRLGVQLARRFAVEGEATVIPTKVDPDASAATVLGLRGHLRVNLATGTVRPFLLAGYGAQILRTSSAQMRNDSDQAIHWGAGVAISLSDVIELRLDGRHLIVPDRSTAGATNEIEATVGLSFRLGGERRVSPKIEVVDPIDTVGQRPSPPPVEPTDGDADGDGVKDKKDRCPGQKEDNDGFEDNDGCADLDNDGDGIVDAADQCPDQAETKNGHLDDDGCADQANTELVGFTFPRNTDKFDPVAAALLDKAFQVLSRNERMNVEIAGHASEGETKPLELSIARAEAVKEYLVRRGIAEDRLRTVGYGADRPTATNATREGRDKNRRIEFRVVRADE